MFYNLIQGDPFFSQMALYLYKALQPLEKGNLL